MPRRTYYPTFRFQVHELLTYLGQYQASMINNLGIAGTSYATDLSNLVAALNQVETGWPTYDELP